MMLILIVLLVLLLCGYGYRWNAGSPPFDILNLALVVFLIVILLQLFVGFPYYRW